MAKSRSGVAREGERDAASSAEPPARAPELVASADEALAGYAALDYGADAVRLELRVPRAELRGPGGRSPSHASLALGEVDEIAAYARSLSPRRRVYAAVDALLLDNEIGGLVECLGGLADIGVDALMVRDLGVYRLARRHFPGIDLHASAPLGAHDREGARALARMGFARLTAAPELSIREVCDIAAAKGIELEVPVHGALCYSYRGLCLFASPAPVGAPGMSANRGTCAGVCRVAFRVEGDPGAPGGGSRRTGSRAPDGARPEGDTCFPFSMKDLALAGHLDELRAAGAAALGIEGRKRSALYVAAVTDLYRRLLDGKLPPDGRASAEEDIRTVFGRPWTDCFIRGRREKGAPGRAGADCLQRGPSGHRGTPIGEVESVTMRPGEARAFLRFRTSRRLEVRDGLQVDAPGLGRPFGFAIERMRVAATSRRRKTRDVYEAPSRSTVEVELPEEYPLMPPGAVVSCSSSQEVKQRYRSAPPAPGRFRSRRPVEVLAELSREGISARARVRAYLNEAIPVEAMPVEAIPIEARAAVAGPFGPAKDAAKTAAAARSAFEKLGGTPFRLAGFDLTNPDGLFVPASKLNRLRRELAAALEAACADARARHIERVKREVMPVVPDAGSEPRAFRWSVKTDRLAHLAAFEAGDWRGVDEVVVDIAREGASDLHKGLERIAGTLGRERVRLALPAITRAWEEDDLRRKVAALARAGWARWQIGGVSGWGYLGTPEALDVTTDWPMYVTNALAARQLLDMGASGFTLSPEDGLVNMKPLLAEFADRATVVVYHDAPLFISEVRPVTGPAGTSGSARAGLTCPAETRMLSSFGDKVVALTEGCRTVVLHRAPVCLSERLADLARAGARLLRVDFIWRSYAPEEAREVWRAVREGRSVEGARVANFDRGLG